MRVTRLLAVAMLGLSPSLAFAMNSSDITLKTDRGSLPGLSVPADNPQYSQALSFCEDFLLATAGYDYGFRTVRI